MRATFKIPQKDRLADVVSNKNVFHHLSGRGKQDYIDFRSQMFGFNYEKCSDAETNNISGDYQNNSL